MKQKLKKKEQQLWDRISEILWKEWDPIGLYEPNSNWDDEYNSYVPHVFKQAIENCDHVRIAAFLNSTIKQNMGLQVEDNNHRDINVAKIIVRSKLDILGE